MSIVTSRFKAVALLCMSAVMTPGLTAAQSPSDHVIVRPAPRVGPPWLGVTLKPRGGISHAEGAWTNASPGAGVEVAGLMKRSPAVGSGVRVGDRILSVGGEPVDSLADIRQAVRSHRVGESVDVRVTRGRKEQTLKFTLAAKPSGEQVVRNHLLGYPAPEFMFRFVGDGKDVHLSELRGKPTIIDFWATWCGPCHKVQSELAAVKAKFGDKINILGVSDEDAKVVRAHLKRYPARYAMAVDEVGESRSSYVIDTIPQIVILDAEHNVAAVVFGANKQQLIERKLQNLIAAPD